MATTANSTRPIQVAGGGSAPKPAPAPPANNPTQLLAEAEAAVQLLSAGMAAYSTLMQGIRDAKQNKVSNNLPEFCWTASLNEKSFPVESTLTDLLPEDRIALLQPLANLHFMQMLNGAKRVVAAGSALVGILQRSKEEADQSAVKAAAAAPPKADDDAADTDEEDEEHDGD